MSDTPNNDSNNRSNDPTRQHSSDDLNHDTHAEMDDQSSNSERVTTKQTTSNKKKTDIQNPELWEFPMDYPIRIIGHENQDEQLHNEVKLILGGLFPDFDLASIKTTPSRTGRYQSLKAILHLTCAEQVNRLYAALDDADTVRMVL